MKATGHCLDAQANLTRSIDVARRFPLNVFIGAWSSYHFFDPDWIFEANFMTKAAEFLRVEGSECGCLWDLDNVGNGLVPARFCFGRETLPKDFRAVLHGRDVSQGWISQFSRFGCGSNLGQWAIYCERSTELAVIAFGADVDVRPFLGPLDSVRARPADVAIEQGAVYGLRGALLSEPARSTLRREYHIFRQ